MSVSNATGLITRRRALLTGGSVAGGLVLSTPFRTGIAFGQEDASRRFNTTPPESVQREIESIIDAQGSVSDEVFTIEIDRNDLPNVTLHGVPIKPSFEINGDLVFQRLQDGATMMNGDLCIKKNELDAFIRELITHDIVFQAEHQHMYEYEPIVFFVHFRAMGDASRIAKGLKAALNVTSTPFPQTMPSNPTTPLPADEIGKILGAAPTIGSDGVVSYNIPRAEWIRLGGHHINPYLNVQTNVFFEPYGGGQNAAVIPDFGMIASEVNNVVNVMQKQGWDIGCHYNQETDEFPQLYFSHQFKTGDSIQLAKEVRKGLDQTN